MTPREYEAKHPANFIRNGFRVSGLDESGFATLCVTDPRSGMEAGKLRIEENLRPNVAAMLREAARGYDGMMYLSMFIVEREGRSVSLQKMSIISGLSTCIVLDAEDAWRLAEWLYPEEEAE